jgi:drug/metabolite transporter (DMT)-like permease
MAASPARGAASSGSVVWEQWPLDAASDAPPDESAAAPAAQPGPLLTHGHSAFVWQCVAIIPVFAGSTGPLWFKLMPSETNGVTKAAWRMTLACVILAPLALFEMRSLNAAQRTTLLRLALPTGVVMGGHFACVAAAVNNTSFSHAMVTMNVAPVFFTLIVFVRHWLSRAVAARGSFTALPDVGGESPRPFVGARAGDGDATPPSPAAAVAADAARALPVISRALTVLEAAGAALATLGIVVLVSGDTAATLATDTAPTLVGDALGIAASALMAAYLLLGTARGALPIYSWLWTLHVAAALSTGAAALAAGASFDAAPRGLFGWAAGGRPLGATVGAAVLPSIFGHGLVNFLTAGRLPAFVVSIFLLFQPCVGLVVSWALGVQGAPGAFALLSVPLVIGGAYLATVGSAPGGDKRTLADVLCGTKK